MNLHENVKNINLPFRKHFMLWIAQQKYSDIAFQESLHVIFSYQEQMPRICRWRPWKKRQKRRIIFCWSSRGDMSLFTKQRLHHGRSTYIFACVFFHKISQQSPLFARRASPWMRATHFSPPGFYTASLLDPPSVRTRAYCVRPEEGGKGRRGFFLGGRERDSSESRFDHGWGFPDASLRCAVNQVVADEKRRKIWADWYFWHFHFHHA